ncbi:molybdopterin molybdotransferase MoeA [uncultured Corynebacterium sp.]|uniref:molybdopterin molybdotransferase MoeA n=1 Tax=uncultured Corynebacterium sp. TaxID=159447 RepID=UPI00263A1797|nr:molybdopterin molybdotransferase MoeA [uncultured Corynebacterium sp.]
MSRTPEAHFDAVAAALGARESEILSPLEAAARGAVLARDVQAVREQPAFDNSQMDGYAVGSTEARTARVGATIAAGDDPATAYPEGLGELAVPIMTGAKLPSGTRAVIPVERCEPAEFLAEGAEVQLPATEDGVFVRPAGSDIAAGDVLARAGERVSPALVGALASQGIEEVTVVRAGRIVIVTGGAEVAHSPQQAGAATIPDANGPMLRALAARHGIEVATHVRTSDEPDVLREQVRAAIAEHRPDAVVTSGGISHGKFEVVRLAFPEGWYGHVSQQPGGPQGLSACDGVPVIGLPGNPISTLVSSRLYVAPLLGHAPKMLGAPLASPVTGIEGREQFLRGRIENGAVRPIGGASSHLLAQGAAAQCLIRVPAGAQLAAGELVSVYPL